MKYQRRAYYIAAGVAAGLLLNAGAIACQNRKIGIDVKTSLTEKAELAPIKKGVIEAINASNWAKVEEVGERFALWVSDYTRAALKGDSVQIGVLLELRKPSLFRRGELLNSRQIVVSYAIRDTTTDISAFMQAYLEKHNRWDDILGLVDMGMMGAITHNAPSVGLLVQKSMTADAIPKMIRRLLPDPTKQRILEGFVVWSLATPIIYELCTKTNR